MKSPELDQLDRKIIHALSIDARAPFSRLADVLGVSEQTVARRYRTMHEAGIVRVVGQLDSQRIGQSDWALRIRCVPGTSTQLAMALARRPDTSWVQLGSGGTEIFCTVRAHDMERTALLLEQLPSSRQIVTLDTHLLLHMFVSGGTGMSELAGMLEPDELARVKPAPIEQAPRQEARLRPEDLDLVRALARDGRATYRQLAARTHWHESTVRRRVEELMAAGILSFDLDLASDWFGIGRRAMLWMSVVPSKLMETGRELAAHAEVPFVAATSGRTNLVSSVACRDDVALFTYLTERIAGLDGVTAVETAPIIRSVKRHVTLEALLRGPDPLP